MANPIWDGKRWRYRVTQDKITKTFTSSTPGRKGKAEVEAKALRFARLDENCRLADAWTRYLEEVKHLTGPENFKNTESIGRLYILPELGSRRLPQIRTTDFQQILFSVRKENGEPMAKKTLQNIRGVMVNFSKFCIRSRLWDQSLTELKVPRDAHKVGKTILQPDQARRLFNEFDDDWYINLWRFLLATGCRPGEALGLMWSDIRDGFVHIDRAYNYRGRMTEGKNENARRSFALNSMLEKIMQDQKEKTWRINSKYVFCNHIGEPGKQTATKNSWDAISRALGTSASPYSLRHTFISYMAQSLPEQALKSIVGHSVNMDTYGVYGHAVNGEAEQTAEKINITLLKKLN